MNQYFKEYLNSLEWVQQLGIPLRGRHILYKKRLESIFENSNVLLKNLIDRYTPILHNTFEIMCIYKAFRTFNVNKIFLEKLCLAIRGPEFLEQERGDKDSNKARNYQFELYMAAMFKNAGYVVEFSDVSDFEINLGYAKILIECKRIRSIEKLKKELKDAQRSLSKKCGIHNYASICVNMSPTIYTTTTIVNNLEETEKYTDKPEIIKVINNFEPQGNTIGIFYLTSFVKIDQINRNITCPFRILTHFNNRKCYTQQVKIMKSIFGKTFFTGMYQ